MRAVCERGPQARQPAVFPADLLAFEAAALSQPLAGCFQREASRRPTAAQLHAAFERAAAALPAALPAAAISMRCGAATSVGRASGLARGLAGSEAAACNGDGSALMPHHPRPPPSAPETSSASSSLGVPSFPFNSPASSGLPAFPANFPARGRRSGSQRAAWWQPDEALP